MKKSKGIVLKTTKWREADLMVSVLMDSGSLASYLAINALRSKKRFGGGILESTHYISFSWEEKKEDKKIMLDASLEDDFSNIRSSYDKIQNTMAAIKLLLRASQESLENKDLFNLLGNFLKNYSDEVKHKHYLLHFEVRFLQYCGILSNDMSFLAPFTKPLSANKEIQLSAIEFQEVKSYIENIKSDYF